MIVSAEVRARLFLLGSTEPPASAVHDFVVVNGPVEAVERIGRGAAPAAVLDEITRPYATLDRDLRAIESGAARFVTPEDPDWPVGRFSPMGGAGLGPPLALWVRGRSSLAELAQVAVTVTGARAATGYGSHVAADFGYELARAGVSVIGGGSYGVEASAHRGALAGDGPTVVVLACGVDVAHPEGNTRVFDEITATGGLLVSEYGLGTPRCRARLVARCRLLAALSAATVIVEAGPRSGVAATAGAARVLGRRVYGVPGPITSAMSTGVNELLRTGDAAVITSIEQITSRIAQH